MSADDGGNNMIKRTLLAAAFACATPAFAAVPATLTYDHVTLIDGTGAPERSDMAVVVKGERIAAIVPTKDAKGSLRDMHGAYAIPGLINSHVHLSTPPDRKSALAQLRRFVYSGVTAVRDMAGDARLLADLSSESRFGEIPAADIYYAALVAGPEFFFDPRVAASSRGYTPGTAPFMHAVNGKTNIPLLIAAARGTGATGLKIYADLPPNLVDALTAEAHTQGLIVWNHADVFPTTPKEGIEAGADTVSHTCMLAYQASAQNPRAYHNRAPVDAAKFKGETPTVVRDLFTGMKKRGTILDATLYVYRVMWQQPHKTLPYCPLALAERLTGEAHRAGVRISAGTDAPADWNSPYPSLYDELGLLVHGAGFTPADALQASSMIGAATIGQRKNMGTLEPGKLANIAFLTKDPTEDIANLKTIVLTVKRGKEYPRAGYKPIAKDEMGDAD